MKDESKNSLRIGGGKILLLLFFALISGGMAWGQVSVEQTLFSETSADNIGGDANLFYTTAIGGGTSAPAIYSNEIRLYQNSSGNGGGTITIFAKSGYALKSVTIGSSMKTSIAYTLEDGTTKSVVKALSANGKYTVSDIDVESITFYCMGKTTETRLYVNYLAVTYEESTFQRISAPQLSVADGTRFDTSLDVNIIKDSEEVKVYYTMSNTGIPEDPTESSAEFPMEGLQIEQTTTLKVIAMLNGNRSSIVTATYTKIVPIPADILMGIVFEKAGLRYAAMNEFSSGALKVAPVDIINGKIINDAPENGMGWYVDETAMTIKTASEQYLAVAGGKTTNLKFQTSKSVWSYDDTNACWYQMDGSYKRTLLYSIGTTNGVKAYAVSNINGSAYSGTMQFMPFTDGYVREVAGASVEAPRYGTICLPCDVAAEDFSGAEFYSVLGKVMTGDEVTAIALSEPLTELKAGTPYIFSATDEKLLLAYTGEAVEEAKTANGLVGSLSDRLDVPEGKHLLTNNTVQICGTGCYIASNRAYVDFDQMEVYVPTAGVNTRLISFDGVTVVRERKKQAETRVDVYSMDGVCIRRQMDIPEAMIGLPKGLYIVNGKTMTVN